MKTPTKLPDWVYEFERLKLVPNCVQSAQEAYDTQRLIVHVTDEQIFISQEHLGLLHKMRFSRESYNVDQALRKFKTEVYGNPNI